MRAKWTPHRYGSGATLTLPNGLHASVDYEGFERCPQCGEATPELREGYCRECCDNNQAALDRHNAECDRWQAMTDAERDAAIKQARP